MNARSGGNGAFDRDAQLRLCAAQLEILRTTLGERWPALRKTRLRQEGLAEAKSLVKHIIRVASESVDFYATVDFVTQQAEERLARMREASNGRALLGHRKNWDQLTHEHMVPGSAVLHALTELAPGAPILPVLDELSFRALVSGSKRGGAVHAGTDAHLLDSSSGLKQRLPEVEKTGLFARGFASIDEVPFRLRPLMRYDAVGLLDGLVPQNARAASLKQAYLDALPPARPAGPADARKRRPGKGR